MLDTYVAFDLETTGLNVENDEIIEVGAIKVIEGCVVEEFSHIINPHRAVDLRIHALTGITPSMLAAGEEKNNIIKQFLNFVGEYHVLGHNLMFDYKFMKTAAQSLGYSFEKKGVDTLAIARKMLAQLEHKKLDSLCDYYGYKNQNAHRATHDARATAYIYEQMKKEFGEENSELFEAKEYMFKPKKQESATIKQKRYLMDLVKYHKIECDTDTENLSKSEASKLIDSIILNYGMIKR